MAQGRAKRPHQKVKTGCMTCRKRRIKCDEAKPACRQCTDSLRRCEGYQPPQTWLFKPRRSDGKALVGNAVATIDDPAVTKSVSPFAALGDCRDKRSFQFWMEQAAPIFSCYFGHSFWTELLPKIGLDATQPAIKHLLLATASVVEAAALNGVPLDENAVYQSHYTKAIQATVSSPQTESVLMACLLFACCDFMKGSVVSGLQHIHSGLKIIDEWCKSTGQNLKPSKEATLIVGAIAPIFVSYVDKAPTYGMGDVTVSTQCKEFVCPNSELPFVGHFDDLHRALHALDGIAHHIARMADWRRKAWVASPPQKMKMLLSNWHLAFDTFEANMLETRRQRFALSIQLLRVFYTMLSIMLPASSSLNESIYSEFEPEFKWIISKYDSFSLTWAEDPPSKEFSGPGNMEYHMGYIPPLFFTAIKCRTPSIRMAALRHLASLRVVENNWTSCAAYQLARKITNIENPHDALDQPTSNIKLRAVIDSNQHCNELCLIRPVEAFISDKKQTRAVLQYTSYPYECDSSFPESSTPLMQDTVELKDCPSATLAQWPLSRILRIGGYQGGAVKPVPTGCNCGKSLPHRELLLSPKS